jgi:hypothetical protein
VLEGLLLPPKPGVDGAVELPNVCTVFVPQVTILEQEQ